MLGQIKYDINQFHPSLRLNIENELKRLNASYPVFFKNGVEVKVVSSYNRCSCGNCGTRGFKEMDLNNPATTVTNGPQQTSFIYMNEAFYGNSANPERIDELSSYNEDHGKMIVSPACILTHEYGHVFWAMCRSKFGVKKDQEPSTLVQKKMENFIEKIADAYDHSSFAGMMSVALNGIWLKSDNGAPLVSEYCYKDPDEAIAETFMATYWGDPQQKLLPSVLAMEAVISEVYKEVFAEARSAMH